MSHKIGDDELRELRNNIGNLAYFARRDAAGTISEDTVESNEQAIAALLDEVGER